MKSKLIIVLTLLTFGLASFAQSVMTDEQIIKYLQTELQKGTSQQKIVTDLIGKGVTTTQLTRVRKKLQQLQKEDGLNGRPTMQKSDRLRNTKQGQMSAKAKTDKKKAKEEFAEIGIGGRMTTDNVGRMDLVNEEAFPYMNPEDSLQYWIDMENETGRKVFGRNIFNNENLTFEPASNIATPENYILGAGDAVNVDIWGESQTSLTETISPDGTIVIDGVGPVKLGGMTVNKARAYLKGRLGEVFGGCKIDLTLGETRTIQVQVMGEVVAPGTYSLSSLSSAFNALYAAGGINDIGTLRDIKVYRSGREIATIDVYDYLINGSNAGDIRMSDNDVIVVGPYNCLVDIEGKVKRPMWYEMRKTESLKQLLKYSGGFTGDAYTKNVRVIRKTGAEYSIHSIEEFEMGNFTLSDEDVVEVDSVRARFSNLVEVRGAVKHAGQFQLGGNIQTVRSLLLAADGLREDAYEKRAIMHREKDDMTLEMIGVDINGILDGTAADIPLKNNDVLFVPSKTEMLGERTVTINGEITYPGKYPFAENTTIQDILLQSGGLTDAASLAKVDIFRRIRDIQSTTDNNISAESFSLSLDENYNITKDTTFYLKPFDIVYIRKSPAYETQQNVQITGCVNFIGQYSMTKKDYRLSDLIKASGGFTNLAYVKGARLTRRMTKDEKLQRDEMQRKTQIQLYEDGIKEGKDMNMELADTLLSMKSRIIDTYPVAIELDKALAYPESEYDIVLRDGDLIDIPQTSNTIKISGEVTYPVSMNYEKGRNLYWYIRHAGGYTSAAHKSKVYGIHMNGSVVQLSSNSVRDIEPGTEIVVPTKNRNKKMSTAEIVSLSSGAASLASVIVAMISILKK